MSFIAAVTAHEPIVVAVTAGKVPLKRKEIAQLIGKVFIQKSAVNLLSTVLDTPEFFWSAPDNMQVCWPRLTLTSSPLMCQPMSAGASPVAYLPWLPVT